MAFTLERKSFHRMLACLLLVNLWLFIRVIYLALSIPEHRTVFWDLNVYYMDAARFFVAPTLESLQQVSRPLFSLPALLILKVSGAALTYPRAVAVNAAFYHCLLLGAVAFYARQARVHWSEAGVALSCFLALPQVSDNSIQLYGDVACTALIVLFAALLLWARRGEYRSPWRIIWVGIVLAFSFQLKPFLTLVFGLLLFVFLLQAVVSPPELGWKRGAFVFCLGLLAVGTMGLLIYPRNLPVLMAELHYSNEVLKYWASKDDIFHSWFWIPFLILTEFCIPVSLVLFYGLAVSFVEAAGFQFDRFKRRGLFPWLKGFLEREEFALPIATLLIAFGASFFLKAKGARTFLFLLLLFPLFAASATKWTAERRGRTRLWRFACLFIVAFNGISLVFQLVPFPEIASPFIAEGQSRQAGPSPITNTYEQAGIPELYALIEADWRRAPWPSERPTIFFPHSSYRYNESVFNSFACQRLEIRGFMPPDCESPPLVSSSALFRLGGYGKSGGIPKEFFAADYMVVVKGQEIGHLRGTTEFYNRLFSNRILLENPVFMEGLIKIAEFKNVLGHEIRLYRRDEPVPLANFARMVGRIASQDSENLWNIPLVASALRADPTSEELRKVWQGLIDPVNWASKTYRLGTPEHEARLKNLVALDVHDPALIELDYPKVLVW